ncbi:MAG: glycosyltransferase [Alphaproteobacteria bacterium]|nr:glycosyltransferase [Alphaproteobacteria bacterium]
MVKEPRPGRVKTRLGADIGMVQSAWWFRHQAGRLVRRLSRDPRWHCVLAVSPDVEGLTSRVWPVNVARIAQGQGDLGARMAWVFRSFPSGPVVIIGADIPAIEPYHIARAFRALGDHDAVFGPADDGGYWLIGLKRMRALPPDLLGDVRWSSEHALMDSEAGLRDMRIARVDMLRDVDRASDL